MCIVLAIESSCDDTSASVCENGKILTNIISSQLVHVKYGGVVPEFASRAHQRNIVDVVQQALDESKTTVNEISAIAYTQGPGLAGSLLVAASFAKGFSLANNIPLIGVDHLQAHVLSNLIDDPKPQFPFLCLLVSGGHTQLIIVENYSSFNIIGSTIDDAAGEAFDKAAKVIGLPYPGGPWIDRLAAEGDANRFFFPEPKIPDLNFSFSGLKTSFLYKVRDGLKEDKDFIEKNKSHLCASYQRIIVDYLAAKLMKAVEKYHIREVCLAGGVAANSSLRNKITKHADNQGFRFYYPSLQYCTDNAAMIAITAYYKYMDKNFGKLDDTIYSG